VIRLKKNRKNVFAMVPGMRSGRCPYCGSHIELRSSEGVYRKGSPDELLYVCSRYPACNAYVRVHPGTNKPMGSLADPALRRLRQKAHQEFNKLYQTGIMNKDQAYAWLADMLQMPRAQAHIGHLGEHYCQLVIDESRKVLTRYWALHRQDEGGATA